MKAPSVPPNEEARLRALRSYAVLDTLPEPAFDAITAIAAHIVGVPIALVSLVDVDRQWFKSRYGLDAPETPRDVSFCGHVVATDAALVVPDAHRDPRFADNPLVTGAPRVRFYAGVPLRNAEGFVLGTLCAIDHEARELTSVQRDLLEKLAGQVVDQLELRRQAVELRGKQATLTRFLRFFDVSLDLLSTADATLHFHDLNPAWEHVLGWTPVELRARPFPEFVHPDDLARTFAEAERLLAGATTVHFENRYRHKDGRWVPLSWSATVHEGVFYAAARDMSAYKAKEAALAASEMRLRTLFDTVADAIVTVDEEGRVESANHAVEALFGYAPDEVSGRSAGVLLADADPAAYLQPGTGREQLARRRDGSTFHAELAVSELNVGGRRLFTLVLRDISERKKVERLQSEFVSMVSHELRTPLTSIRGSLGLVAGGITGELPAEAKEYVDIAVSNCDRLVRLINDILDVEKMRAGSMEFRPRTLDLAEAVRQAVAANESYASAYGARLELARELPAGDVLADPDRLAQVLANLLSNASKFSPRGGAVEVSVTRLPRHLRVTVRDHGPGVPEAFRERIFQRFAQADASDTRQRGGTGLGLSIAKAFVERMHGRIGFEPAEGGGTQFFFELPYLPTLASYGESSRGSGPRVLVCEDDPEVAHLIERTLVAAGGSVHVAPTLERARRLLAAHRYDAVTLDLMLADGDAAPLIRELRANPATRETPVLVVSGAAGRLGAAAVQVTNILAKPFDEAVLLESILSVVKRCGRVSPRVLHVEDDPDIRRIVRRLLPESWSVLVAADVAGARRILEEGEVDMVLLDLTLPDGGGDELLGFVGGAHVIIFSATEVSASLSQRVAAALVKSRSSATDVRDAMVRLFDGDRAHGGAR